MVTKLEEVVIEKHVKFHLNIGIQILYLGKEFHIHTAEV
jgi:hypothetical protein